MPITPGSREISTIDLYGRRFVLFAGPNGAAWVSASECVMRRLDVPFDTYRFGVELTGAENMDAHGIGTDGALLVRLDGFVAWRAEAAVEDPEGKLEQALSRLLCRRPGAPPEVAHGSSRVRRRVRSGSSFGPE